MRHYPLPPHALSFKLWAPVRVAWRRCRCANSTTAWRFDLEPRPFTTRTCAWVLGKKCERCRALRVELVHCRFGECL